jgi:hypothetical protein
MMKLYYPLSFLLIVFLGVLLQQELVAALSAGSKIFIVAKYIVASLSVSVLLAKITT